MLSHPFFWREIGSFAPANAFTCSCAPHNQISQDQEIKEADNSQFSFKYPTINKKQGTFELDAEAGKFNSS